MVIVFMLWVGFRSEWRKFASENTCFQLCLGHVLSILSVLDVVHSPCRSLSQEMIAQEFRDLK